MKALRISVFSFRSRSEVRFFLASPTKNFPKTFIIEIFVGVKTWLNQTKSSLSLLFVIGLVENPIVTRRREKLPCNSTSSSSLSFAIVVVASSFVVSHLLSDKPPVSV